MARRDEKSVLGALGETPPKPVPAGRRVPQDCGDIGLKIGRNGTWYYRESAIGRKKLVKLFASVLRQEKDGRYYLVTPVERVLIQVEDAPFLAVGMTVEGSGERQLLTFRTNLDDEVEAGPDHPLSFRPEKNGSFTPYVLVRDKLKARLTRPVYYDLVAAAVSEGKGGKHGLGVWSGGTFFAFPPLAL
ncbi:MAG TPA: DUF1285 domain-containing protein [Methyloceanibacter sp.]|nr:DUF1285 domain-containing protein [Methyloceanibacter sp.]